MVAITLPANIADIYNTFTTQGLSVPDAELCMDTCAKIQFAKTQIQSWNNPDAVLNDLSELTGAGVDNEFFNFIADQLDFAATEVSNAETHLRGIFGAAPGTPGSLGAANLVKNMSIATVEKARQETLNLVGSNPCDAISNLFNTISGGLNTSLNAISAAVDEILQKIGEGIAALVASIAAVIQPALDAINAAIDEIVSAIAKEIDDFAKAFADIFDFSMSLTLPSLFKDPCLRAVLDVVAPPELKAALKIADDLTS